MSRTTQTPEQVAEVVSAFINSVGDVRALAEALANDHPTLLGQAAKAMGLAVMMRTTTVASTALPSSARN
jgi:hypothetical protein